jgi:hypothetical protein
MAMNERRDLDVVIDEVARAMTSAAPPASLRQAVARRVESPVRWTPGGRTWTAAAAVAVLALMAVVPRLGHEGDGPSARVTRDEPEPPQAARAETTSPAIRAAPATERRVARRAERIGLQTTGPVVTGETVVIDPLAIAALATDSVVVEAMPAPMDVSIEPIAIAPMRVRELGELVE